MISLDVHRHVLREGDYADFLYHPDQRLLAGAGPMHTPTKIARMLERDL